MGMVEKPMSCKELAAWLGCCSKTIRHLADDLGMPHLRLGGPAGAFRFILSDVTKWLRQNPEKAQLNDLKKEI